MAKTIIPGYNGFAEWTPELVFGSSMVGYKDDATPGITPVWNGGAIKLEDTVTTSPDGAKWLGVLSSFKINEVVVPSSTKYLKAHGEKQRSVAVIHTKANEEITLDIELALQPRYYDVTGTATARDLVHVDGAFGLFLYCIGDGIQDKDRTDPAVPANNKNAVGLVCTTVYCLGDKIGSVGFSAGIENSGSDGKKTNYMSFWGCQCKEATLSIAEDENIKFTSTFSGAGAVGPTPEDFISVHTYDPVTETNSAVTSKHAAQPSPMLAPLSYDNIRDFCYRGREFCGDYVGGSVSGEDGWTPFDPVRSIEINISNDLKLVKDIGAPEYLRSTRIVGAVIMNREVTVTMEIDYNSFVLFQKVRDFDEFQVCFDIYYNMCSDYNKAARVYITGIKFTEMPLELNPEDVIGDSITSLPVGGFSIEEIPDPENPPHRPGYKS